VVDTRLVVVQHANRKEIAAARGANACPRAAGSGASSSSTDEGSGSGGSGTAAGHSKTAPAAKPKPARHRGVLGARFARKAVEVARGIPLWLYVLLGLAIVLLAAASLPLRVAPTRRAATVLASHRGVMALAGGIVLVAVMVTYTLL
jgi:cobalamin biosynthesis Mg chelatase CobN